VYFMTNEPTLCSMGITQKRETPDKVGQVTYTAVAAHRDFYKSSFFQLINFN